MALLCVGPAGGWPVFKCSTLNTWVSSHIPAYRPAPTADSSAATCQDQVIDDCSRHRPRGPGPRRPRPSGSTARGRAPPRRRAAPRPRRPHRVAGSPERSPAGAADLDQPGVVGVVGTTATRSGSSQRSREWLRVRKPASSSSMPSRASAGSIQVSVAAGVRPSAAAQRVDGVHGRLVALAPRPEAAAGGASLRKTTVRTSSGAASIAATRASAPSRSHVDRVGGGHPTRSKASGVDALAAQGAGGPAVHHPLVGEQVAHGPVRAGRHVRVEPGALGRGRERRQGSRAARPGARSGSARSTRDGA